MTGVARALAAADTSELARKLDNADPAAVRAALSRRRKRASDLALLLSPGADAVLGEIAARAREIALWRVGRAIQLYAPLYLSNRCVGRCPYCGFRADRRIDRRDLGVDEVLDEARLLTRSGLQHLLLVAGDDPKHVSVEHICEVIRALRELAPSVSVEVAPLDVDGYRALVAAGADGVTLYQETYSRERYFGLHDRGPKADFDRRLEALDRAGEAGMRKLTAGALWGLAPWREDALRLGLHLHHLQRRWWRGQVAFGMPRLRWVPDDFAVPHPLDDRSFVHVVVALRVFLGDVGVTLSTRESPELRDALVGLGVTQMSAGSRTEPGGYGAPGAAGDQFRVSDSRTPAEVAAALTAAGYDPVWKDWDAGLGPLAADGGRR